MHALRMIGLPTCVYLSVTLVVPWLNGAGGDPLYLEHAAHVLGTCLPVAALAATAVVLLGRRHGPCPRPGEWITDSSE